MKKNIKMKKAFYLFLTLLACTTIFKASADEGMWIPLLLGENNEAEMQAMGFNLTAEDIYSINHGSLKDAVVIFGGGCTGEIVSDQGLMLTNHHCGYGSIQRHSSLEHNYLTDGFWANNQQEELSCPGLTCTMLVRMEDVTEKVLEGVEDNMTESEREEVISNNISIIKEEAVEDTHYSALVKSFYYGNKFYLMVNEIFTDVRLVGAPPSNIGKFGGDTDNWMWPRHTGDFSVFRIYVDQDNNPAEYSEDNVPYTPKSFMEISLKGVEKDDFTFVFGYPGRTQEYVSSYAVETITQIENPIRIKIRDKALNIIGNAMNQDELTRLQYSSKYAGIANGWKKWIGENKGIKRLNAIEVKKEYEAEFEKWANSHPETEAMYGGIINRFEEIYSELKTSRRNQTYLFEAGFRPDILRFASSFRNLVEISEVKETDIAEIDEEVQSRINATENHFKNYNADIDTEVFAALFKIYITDLKAADYPAILNDINTKYNGDTEAYANELFRKSIFSSKKKTIDFLKKYKQSKYKKIIKDPAYNLISAIRNHYFQQVLPKVEKYDIELDSLMRLYMRAQMEMDPDGRFYPEANFTLRVGYGKIDDYLPRDAVHYGYFTTLEGIMEKEDPAIFDYVVEDKLKELYSTKDYGRYADKDGSMHVCFTASNHTTGGNSGSPVLNADGQLIGINFDRNWEGTMSDLMYDPDMCRNISIDIRYCLFIIDKFAGATHLIDEMKIIE